MVDFFTPSQGTTPPFDAIHTPLQNPLKPNFSRKTYPNPASSKSNLDSHNASLSDNDSNEDNIPKMTNEQLIIKLITLELKGQQQEHEESCRRGENEIK